MKFKEFEKWCEERASDGCWGKEEALVCIDILRVVRKIPFWRRERYWKDNFKEFVANEIVYPIEKKMKEIGG